MVLTDSLIPDQHNKQKGWECRSRNPGSIYKRSIGSITGPPRQKQYQKQYPVNVSARDPNHCHHAWAPVACILGANMLLRRFEFQRVAALITSRASASSWSGPLHYHSLYQTATKMLCSNRSCSAFSKPQQLWQATPAQQYCRATLLAGRQARSFSLQHSPVMRPLHVSSPRSKGPARPLLPMQAAGGGGAGGSGGKKGYSSGDSSGDSGGLWGSYNKLLQQYPLLVKAITTALLSAVGNLICQFGVEGKSELDWKRFNTFTALGFVWVAPCLHFWFGALNRIVTSSGNSGALMRMALDQLGFAPLFISSMIAILSGLDGKSVDQCVAVVKRDLPDAIKANWALWVPAQFINFRWARVAVRAGLKGGGAGVGVGGWGVGQRWVVGKGRGQGRSWG